MKRSKTQKGITLIALILTIVVLLILASAAINEMQNKGILSYAENTANKFNQAQSDEKDVLGGYLNYLKENIEGSGGGTLDVTDGTTMFARTTNTKIKDIYGNKITIPAGFKISVENTGYTKDTIDVTKGIVIEDESENQFVWVPVGKIYTDIDKTELLAKTITLGRYKIFTATNGIYTPVQTAENYATATEVGSYTEDTSSNHYSGYKNAIARNIGEFVTSATTNGGYYLGRYEAGKSNDTLVCKYGQNVYNNITQPDASSLCKSMYSDGYSTGTFSSDLINSYAWDTAIIFIQTFGTRSNSSTYESTGGRSATSTDAPQTTGTNILEAISSVDEQLNIYDMAGNCFEWSTETFRYSSSAVYRGSYFSHSYYSTSGRVWSSAVDSIDHISFRPLIYVGL